MRSNAALAALVALLVLGGCSLFGSDDDEEEAQAAAAERAEAAYEPVTEVRDIEIGRTRDGIVITALGLARGAGYALPLLRPRRDGEPGPEGYLDFDFVARAPDPALGGDQGAGSGGERARMVRADHLVDLRDLRGVQGIRIHSDEGGMQMNF